MKVGFIGLGIMGKPMCKNIMKAGYEMVVTTHNKETLKEMEALGAKTVTCGREVAEEADVIITMLPNSPQVREVALGEGGIIEGGKESRNRSGACIPGNPRRTCRIYSPRCKSTYDDGQKLQTGIPY